LNPVGRNVIWGLAQTGLLFICWRRAGEAAYNIEGDNDNRQQAKDRKRPIRRRRQE